MEDSRFVRNVLFNHERTQRELSQCSKRADREVSRTSDAVSDSIKTVDNWRTAQEHFQMTVAAQLHQEVYSAATRHNNDKGFQLSTNKVSDRKNKFRRRLETQATLEMQPLQPFPPRKFLLMR